MGKTHITKLLAGVLTAAFLVGCATGGGGMSDEDSIKSLVNEWKAAFAAKNIDGLMAMVSDNFEDFEWGDKAGLREFLSDAADQGFFDDAEVYDEDMEITIDGDNATVYPIEISGAFGAATLEFTLAKENGKWMMVGLER